MQQISVFVAVALLAQMSLSFLGIGIKPPIPSRGLDVGRSYRFMRQAAWLVFVPGLAILLVTLAVNFLGDGLRDAAGPERARGEIGT
jgi:ABC-type dipeptide/oligopeptide/nickel transport system permease subunit